MRFYSPMLASGLIAYRIRAGDAIIVALAIIAAGGIVMPRTRGRREGWGALRSAHRAHTVCAYSPFSSSGSPSPLAGTLAFSSWGIAR